MSLAKKFSVTVYPQPLTGDYLTVSDAMNQVLDLIEALERTEAAKPSDRHVVWRLVAAHTNSPPFTVEAEPFPVRPELTVVLEANRVATLFASDLSALLDGRPSPLMAVEAKAPISRVLDRNLNGIGRTEIRIGDDEIISLRPQSAKVAKLAIERAEIEAEVAKPDWQRTEFGTVEGEIAGLTRWNGKPALQIIERLSEQQFTCVVSSNLSERVGPAHQWSEVWEGRRVAVSGALHYASDGALKRAEIDEIEEIAWTDIPVAELAEIDVLNGRSLHDYLEDIRGSADG